jgi:hypothetical protein
MATPPNPPSSSAKLTHTVIFGSISRILAVQEVKPGVNVAVFNILGDWEVNEAIGAELAPLVPAGTDMLLMPDGKVHVELEKKIGCGRGRSGGGGGGAVSILHFSLKLRRCFTQIGRLACTFLMLSS